MSDKLYVRLGSSRRPAVSGGVGRKGLESFQDFVGADIDAVADHADHVYIKIGRSRKTQKNFPMAIAIPGDDAIRFARSVFEVVAKLRLGERKGQHRLVERLLAVVSETLLEDEEKPADGKLPQS